MLKRLLFAAAASFVGLAPVTASAQLTLTGAGHAIAAAGGGGGVAMAWHVESTTSTIPGSPTITTDRGANPAATTGQLVVVDGIVYAGADKHATCGTGQGFTQSGPIYESASAVSHVFCYKIAGGSEPSNYVVTWDDNTGVYWISWQVTVFNGVTSVDASGVASAGKTFGTGNPLDSSPDNAHVTAASGETLLTFFSAYDSDRPGQANLPTTSATKLWGTGCTGAIGGQNYIQIETGLASGANVKRSWEPSNGTLDTPACTSSGVTTHGAAMALPVAP